MKVILREYVTNLGEAGELAQVAPGYARNYLIPKKLAFEATKENIRDYETNLKQRARKIARMIKEAEERKAKIEAAGDLIFQRRAGEEGKLFGSVTSADIEEALKAKGFEIDKRDIILDRPLKHLGEFEARVKVYSKVNAIVKVEIQPEEVAAPEEAQAAEATGEEAEAAEAEAGETPAEETTES